MRESAIYDDDDNMFFDPPVAPLASFGGSRATGRDNIQFDKALTNYEKYFNKPEGTATVEEVEAMPGGIAEWCKDDVLEIMVGSGEDMKNKMGNINASMAASSLGHSSTDSFLQPPTDKPY